MKKIINNRVYDSDKARRIGTWDNGKTSDLDLCSEELYRKRTGEYFLHGEGGARSKYGRAVGQDRRIGSEDIIPMTAEEARIWAEEHLSADGYEAEFGEIAEDDSRVIVSITLPRGMLEQYKRDAAIAGTSVSALIESRLKQA